MGKPSAMQDAVSQAFDNIASAAPGPQLVALGVAAAIGFLIGFEREWSHRSESREAGKQHRTFAGARTFTLGAIVGGLAGMLDPTLLLAASGFAGLALFVAVAYWVRAQDGPQRGGTTEVALLAVYLLGCAATRGNLVLAAAAGVGVAWVLSLKPSVTKWAEALSPTEARAALRMLLISVVILPILPSADIGPGGVINPRTLWLIVVFISGLSFTGYWLARAFGEARGAVLTAMIGGLASSTAATLSLARAVRDRGLAPTAAASGVIIANLVMIVRVGVVLAVFGLPVLVAAAPVLGTGLTVGAIAAFALIRQSGAVEESPMPPDAEPALEASNPFSLGPALFFAAMLAAIGLIVHFAVVFLGEGSLTVFGFISGVVDVDAINVSVGRQAVAGAISPKGAAVACFAAITSNVLFKASVAWTVGGKSVGAPVALAFAAMFGGGAIAALFAFI